MTTNVLLRSLALVVFLLCAGHAMAQTAATAPPISNYLIPIGPAVGVEMAKKAAAAAVAEARRNNWLMVVVVVDPDGTLVYLERMDNVQLGSVDVAIDKARSAALYKRPTKAFQDALASGGINLRVLALKGASPVEGGVPLIADGKLIGAIGLSGDLAEHDGQCAMAGVNALKNP